MMIGTTIRRLFSLSKNKTREELVQNVYRQASDNMHYILADDLTPEERATIVPVVEVTLDARKMGPAVFDLCGDIIEGKADDLIAAFNKSRLLDFNKVEVVPGADENEFTLNVWYNELSHRVQEQRPGM